MESATLLACRNLDFADETVAPAPKRFDVTRSIRRIQKSLPELSNTGIGAVIVIHKRALGPEPTNQLFTWDELSGLF